MVTSWSVACQLRKPSNAPEEACAVSIGDAHTLNLQSLLRPRTFFVGHAVDSSVCADDLFEQLGGPAAIEAVLAGEDAFIVAYGQTGTGKTRAMLGEDGLVRVACERLLGSEIDHSSVRLVVTFCEVLGDELRDLLSPAAAKAQAVTDAAASAVARHADARVSLLVEERSEDGGGSARLVGLTQMACREAALVRQLVLAAQARRQPAGHFVITISLEPAAEPPGADGVRAFGPRLMLVDLASVPAAQLPLRAEGPQARASGAALRSLLDVVLALAHATDERSARKRARLLESARVHGACAPLLRLLAPALAGRARCLLLCTLSPFRADVGASLRTMRLAAAAAQINFARLRLGLAQGAAGEAAARRAAGAEGGGAQQAGRAQEGGEGGGAGSQGGGSGWLAGGRQLIPLGSPSAGVGPAGGSPAGGDARGTLNVGNGRAHPRGSLGLISRTHSLGLIRTGSGLGLAAAAHGLHLRAATEHAGRARAGSAAAAAAAPAEAEAEAGEMGGLGAQVLRAQAQLIRTLGERSDELAEALAHKEAQQRALEAALASVRRSQRIALALAAARPQQQRPPAPQPQQPPPAPQPHGSPQTRGARNGAAHASGGATPVESAPAGAAGGADCGASLGEAAAGGAGGAAAAERRGAYTARPPATPASAGASEGPRERAGLVHGTVRLVEGYLTKRGGLFPTWKRRFVRLEGQTLSYAAGPHCAQPIRTVRLGPGSAVLDAADDDDPLGFQCAPAGATDRVFHFRAASAEAKELWIGALRAAAAPRDDEGELLPFPRPPSQSPALSPRPC